MSEASAPNVAEHAAVCSELVSEVGKVHVGQHSMVSRLVMGQHAGDHVLP